MSAAAVAVVATSGERHEGKAGVVLFVVSFFPPAIFEARNILRKMDNLLRQFDIMQHTKSSS